MAITEKLQKEIYRVLLKNQNEDIASDILSNPKFIESKETNFINVIKGFTKLSIVKIIGYKNREVVFYNAKEGSVIGVFDSKENLIKQIDTHYTHTIKEPLYKFLDIKIDSKTGQIYGLNVVNNKTNFFLFNNIIELVDLLDTKALESELFYSTIFNVEDEIVVKDDTQIGNKLFGDIRKNSKTKYGFNVDTKTDFTYSFIIDNIEKTTIDFIQFQTDLGQITPKEATWNYNESIKLSEGGTGPSTFQGISIVDILTGERNISAKETSIGSIAISTQKDSKADVEVPFGFNIDTSNPITDNFDANSLELLTQYSVIRPNYSGTFDTPKRSLATKSNFFNGWLSKIKNIINSKPTEINYYGKIIIKTKISKGNNIEININKNLIDKLLNSKKINLRSYSTYIWDFRNIENRKVKNKIDIELDNEIVIIFDEYTKLDFTDKVPGGYKDYYTNGIWQSIILFPYTQQRSITCEEYKYSTDIYENIKVNGKRLQKSLPANTTSQILIEKKDGSDDLIYRAVQEEQNSYDATKPVFLSPEKFYIPLKNRISNEFYLAEFNGEVNKKSQDITKFYNDTGKTDYTDQGGDSYKQELLSPKSIKKVLVNQVPILTSQYSLKGAVITILKIKKDYQIIIEYISTTGSPKRLNVDTTTYGEDIYIEGVSDIDELGTLSKTIIGIGDDLYKGKQSQVFGFNLYRSKANFDYNKIAESSQEISNIKMKHPVIFRQKNLIFWKGYNEDYSKVVNWIQIYPDSFNPYTYLPFNNPNRFFALERLNVNKDNDLKYSRFDREFLDSANSGSLIVANTIAETTDLNDNDNNHIIIYGATNRPLFKYSKTINKEQLENLALNFQLTTSVENNLQSNISNITLSKEFSKLFTKRDSDIWEKFGIDKLIIGYNDSSKLETDPMRYLRIDDDIIKFEISLLNTSNKIPTKLTLRLVNGNDIAIIDLKKAPCIEKLQNIYFEIRLVSDEVLAN